MEEWQRDFTKMLESVTSEVEKFLIDVARDVTEFVDAIAEISEDFSEQVNTAISTEFEQYLNDLIEPILEIYLDFDEDFVEPYYPLTHRVDPLLSNHPACVGCHHYHGQVYGGNLLVCGMHPYGWDSESCPDWENEQKF